MHAHRSPSTTVSTGIYLATVESPSLWETSERTLVLFLETDSVPPAHLTDPTVIGIRPASGEWTLVLWDATTRRAFYSPGVCDGMDESDAADYLENGPGPVV
jgi:hypothetical protein